MKATITIPSDLDELQAVAKITDPGGAITEILVLHRPAHLGTDEILCLECGGHAEEPLDHHYPCATVRAVLDRVDDDIKERLTWISEPLAAFAEITEDRDEDPEDSDDDDEDPKPRKKRRRRARADEDDEPDEDEF